MSDFNSDALKAYLRAVLTEIQRDPELKDLLTQLQNALSTRARTEKSISDASTVTINPFALFTEKGESGLSAQLDGLQVHELIAIVKKYGFDPSRKSHKWKSKDRLVDLILTRVRDSASRGDVFKR